MARLSRHHWGCALKFVEFAEQFFEFEPLVLHVPRFSNEGLRRRSYTKSSLRANRKARRAQPSCMRTLVELYGSQQRIYERQCAPEGNSPRASLFFPANPGSRRFQVNTIVCVVCNN